MKKKLAYLGAALALPFLASAQAITSAQSAGQFLINFINTVAVPVIFAAAFLVFIWGVFQVFILGGSNGEAKAKGQSLMLYGIVGFFLMLSVWGIVNILLGTTNLNNNVPNYPSAPSSGHY